MSVVKQPTALLKPTPTHGRFAVLSLDIEDWFHLDYFDKPQCDRRISMLDGLDIYLETLSSRGILGSFFVLGELAAKLKWRLVDMVACGHDIGSHGCDHVRPLTMSKEAFAQDLHRSKAEIEAVIGHPVEGYRAPCFSLDRPRLDLVQQAGYTYDSSRIEFDKHPLYGTLDMAGFAQCSKSIYQRDSFFEFQVSTLRVWGKHIPISGGGYLRIFPWFINAFLIHRYLRDADLYVLYMHPFELSRLADPAMPSGTRRLTKFRFGCGRSQVKRRLELLMQMLQNNGFHFTTFSRLRQELSGASPS